MSERDIVNLSRWKFGSLANDNWPSSLLLNVSNFFRRTVFARCVEAADPQIQSRGQLDFHLRMACGSLAVLIVSFFGCRLTSIHTTIGGRAIAIVVMLAMVAPLPIYWNDKGRTALREAALVLPWGLLLAATLSFPVLIAARFHMPLQDALFGRIDQALGVSLPGIVAWADHHWLGTVINRTYPVLLPLLAVAGFVPALVGHMKHAREFLLANLLAFAIGLPLFALLPAVGPWYHYHLASSPAQTNCLAQLLSLRLPGPYVFQDQAAGVVCFPSFHVIWAILCTAALWGFRPIRIPLALLSAMIIASTITTGWHYFTDVLGGIAVAVLSMAIARVYAV